jgi:hypothetical protein
MAGDAQGGRPVNGRHRLVYSLEWLDARFQSLDLGEREVWFYCKTSPQSTSVGCYRQSVAVACEEIGNIDAETFERRRDRVCDMFGWQFDRTTKVLYIPEWLEQNPPQSPNVVTSWRKLLTNVPDCQPKYEAVEAIHRYLKDKTQAFRQAFGSYRVSLPEAFAESKAQSQPQQGSEIRDPRFREQGAGALRRKSGSDEKPADAGRENGVTNGRQAKLETLARKCLKFADPNGELETLLDTFYTVARSEHVLDVPRAEALMAVTAALAERRSM